MSRSAFTVGKDLRSDCNRRDGDPILKRVTHVIGFREFRLWRYRDQMFAYKREGNTRLRSEDISAPCECSDGDRMTVAPQFSRNAFAVHGMCAARGPTFEK